MDGGFKVGIAWKGSDSHPGADRYRSIPLRQFAPLASVPGRLAFSACNRAGREQLAEANNHRPSANPPIVDSGDRLGDFYNTAAIIRGLDLVITCDSAPACTWPGRWGKRVGRVALCPDWPETPGALIPLGIPRDATVSPGPPWRLDPSLRGDSARAGPSGQTHSGGAMARAWAAPLGSIDIHR